MLCAKFGWNWPSGSGEEDENVKSLQTDRQTDGQTDAGRQVIRKAHLSFQLRWAKNKGSAQEVSNNRPISLTGVLCRVMEKILFKHVHNFMNNNNVIYI